MLRNVLRADDSAPNIANPHGRAVPVSDDLVIEARRRLELVIRIEHRGLLLAVELPLRLVDRDRTKGRANLFEI